MICWWQAGFPGGIHIFAIFDSCFRFDFWFVKLKHDIWFCTKVKRSYTAIIQHGPLMTSWLIHTLFVLVDPYPFNAVKRLWIRQDVIDSSHCCMYHNQLPINLWYRFIQKKSVAVSKQWSHISGSVGNSGNGWIGIIHKLLIFRHRDDGRGGAHALLTRGGRLCPPHFYSPPQIFKPSAIPATRYRMLNKSWDKFSHNCLSNGTFLFFDRKKTIHNVTLEWI